MYNDNNDNKNQEPDLTSHNYDGIQEYDNPIPSWWHMIFLGSIIFSLFYVVVFHMTGIVPSREQRLANKVAAAEELQFGKLREIPMGEIKLQRVLGSESWLSMGENIFSANCTVCHAKKGEGITGLGFNLTDEKFVHVTSMMDIVDIVTNGTPNKLMPAQTLLNSNEIAMVSAYAASLRGTNIPGPEGTGQGVEIDPFPEPISDEEGG
jgi:cytochrome c oxidase cbb3-type subunit III